MITFITAELCEQAKKALLISLTTLSLGCHYAIKFITAELCEQVYMSWPVVLASLETAHHSRTTIL